MNTVTDVVELAGAWCVTAAGVGAVAALGAVADRISAIRPHPTIACPDGADGAAMVPAMYAPWEDMPDNVALQQRFLTLIDAACRDIGADSDAEGSFAGRGRVFLLLPSAGSARGRQLDVEAIRRAFTEALPGRAHAEVTVRAAEEGVTAVVAGELAGISSGTLDWILIGAVDSLIDPVTLLELLRDGKLRLRGKGGVVPGEACAFALFRRVVTGTKAPVITLTSMATAGEPNHGRADEAAMRGLGEAIGAASSGSGLDVRQCDHVFADLRDDADGELEWWQTTRALWRVTIPERYRRAVAPAERWVSGCAARHHDYRVVGGHVAIDGDRIEASRQRRLERAAQPGAGGVVPLGTATGTALQPAQAGQFTPLHALGDDFAGEEGETGALRVGVVEGDVELDDGAAARGSRVRAARAASCRCPSASSAYTAKVEPSTSTWGPAAGSSRALSPPGCTMRSVTRCGLSWR